MLVVEAAGVRKAFAGVVALNDLEIRIEEGALFGLVGANGAGKTTALNVMGGQVTADSGCVRLAGQDIGAFPTWRRAALGLGRTFQESRLWPDLTVEEHLQVAIDASRRIEGRASGNRAVDDMCSTVELPRKMLHLMPAQMRLLDRRRVELSMAVLKASNLLLIDEIGAGLDVEEARTLYRLIAQLINWRRARAAILVEHKLELLAAFATEIGLIEDGRIRQRASCKESAQVAYLMDRMFDRHRPGVGESPQQWRTIK
jgi:ABC-type branched-subunit amino acid transport system ATPase component